MVDNLQIFLIDDNEIDIVVNTKLIKLANLTDNVVSFSGCTDMMSWFNNISSEENEMRYVILMDIQMPEINGFDCLDKIATLSDEFLSKCRIFMLSSSIDRNDIDRAESNPLVIKVLEKPLDVYLLKRLISE